MLGSTRAGDLTLVMIARGDLDMADTKVVSGGVPHAAEYQVTADQVTILGNGTTEDPLRSSGSSGIEIADEGIVLPGGPFDQLDFVGLVTATDAGDGVAQITVPRGISLSDDGVPVPDNPHNVLDFVGDGVTVTNIGGGVAQIEIPGGSSSGGTMLTWGYGILTTSPAIAFGGCTDLAPTTVHNVDIPVPFAGTVSDLYGRHDSADGSGSVVTYTVQKNGVNTALAVSVPTGAIGQAANLVDSFTVVAGDRLSLQISSLLSGTFLGRISAKVTPS
jgi:hypothetical protein